MERIHYIHEEFDAPALIEEYIEGREMYAAVLGNESPEVLPMVELDLSKLPEGTPKIAGKEVKWEKDTEAYRVTKSAPAEDLDEETDQAPLGHRARRLPGPEAARLRPHRHAPDAEGRGLRHRGQPEPLALLAAPSSRMAATKAGRSYTQLIAEIVDLARARYTAAWT